MGANHWMEALSISSSLLKFDFPVQVDKSFKKGINLHFYILLC